MTWWNYLLLVNIYLTLFYGFYALFLRRETFFQLNRIYLVGAALLSFFIPLVQAEWIKNLFITQKVQYAVYGSGSDINITDFAPIENSSYTLGEIFIMLYLAGVAVLAIRLMWQFIQLRRVIKQVIPSVPYSFFKKINVDEAAEGKEIIMAHEEVHAKQWHSADVLIVEAVMIINWFNPVVYLYRFSVKHIHEFIADRQAIKAGNNKAEYALLLLSQTFNTPAHRLVNPFYNHSLLKQRIMMLQKNKSQRIKLLKYGLSAPLFILMLVLSSATISNSKAVSSINKNAEELFLKPAASIVPTDESKAIAHDVKSTDVFLDAEGKETLGDTTKSQVYTAAERQPTFPGGEKGFGAYLAKNIRYPKAARDKKIQGRVVMTFVVEKDGSLSGIKVMRPVEPSIDAEAIRVIKQSPKWIAGTEKGRKVRVQYAIPINFALTDEPPVQKTGKVVKELELEKPVFTEVEQQPGYPGGNAAMARYLSKTIKYPADARKNKIEGRVITSFVVQDDGSIGEVSVLKGIGHGADEEAIRVIKAMPKWYPGMQNGHPVNVKYTVPITFSLAGKQLNLLGKTDNLKTQPTEPMTASTIKYGEGKTFIELKGKNDPLYIVDGKEVKDIANVDPKDIEIMSVLKDASATAKYGDKAKNGVVLVTLKKAK